VPCAQRVCNDSATPTRDAPGRAYGPRVLVLHPPVDAPIVRPFHYAGSPFSRGLHRGVDFGTAAGAAVRAPCDGTVVWSGEAGVTLRCGGRRVTLLPLAPAVGEGPVRRGAMVGAAGREALHLGVRRPGDPFGYEDPQDYLRDPVSAPPAVAPRTTPRPLRLRRTPRPAPRAAARAPIAPWPAWAGLALVLAGAGVRWRARTRARAAPARAAPQRVP
jgi:hypothetical protein